MADLDRIRWRCRRGLLELDLVLSKFLEERFDSLTDIQKEKFVQLINNSDNDLWDLISKRKSVVNHEFQEIIEILQ
ncbi:MAG: succinate dehydrogenase assembly factor 2 [Burkholderiales bacterium]